MSRWRLVKTSADNAIQQAERAAKEDLYEREYLVRAAMMAALADRQRLQRAMFFNEGVWWPEMQPLTPHERGAVLAELRKAFGLPPEDAHAH